MDNCIAGYNSAIFVYGQTGSGKRGSLRQTAVAAQQEGLSFADKEWLSGRRGADPGKQLSLDNRRESLCRRVPPACSPLFSFFSGKTFTMMGDLGGSDESTSEQVHTPTVDVIVKRLSIEGAVLPPPVYCPPSHLFFSGSRLQRGLAPRMIELLFERIGQAEDAAVRPPCSWALGRAKSGQKQCHKPLPRASEQHAVPRSCSPATPHPAEDAAL